MKISDYRPKAYHVPEDGEDLDIDGSNDGDYIVCPIHPDEIIYVFGTNFWRKEGGTGGYGWQHITVTCWCYKCMKHYKFNLGSYGG